MGFSSSFDQQAHCAAQLRGTPGAVAEEDEGGVGFAGETGEAHRRGLRERGRAVEHHERKGAAAEQDVGAPGGSRGVVWADHPHAFGVAEVHPVARVECALGVDVRDPAMCRDGALDDGAGECRLAAARRSDQLRESPARQPAPEQRGVERGDPGGERRRGRCGGWKELDKLGEGQRHVSGSDSRTVGRKDRRPDSEIVIPAYAGIQMETENASST